MYGSVGGTPIWRNDDPNPGVQLGEGPAALQGVTGKAAKKFIESLDSMSFNPVIFGYIIATSNEFIQRRIMSVVRHIIIALANSYDHGNMTDTTRNARRLKDTIDAFQMED